MKYWTLYNNTNTSNRRFRKINKIKHLEYFLLPCPLTKFAGVAIFGAIIFWTGNWYCSCSLNKNTIELHKIIHPRINTPWGGFMLPNNKVILSLIHELSKNIFCPFNCCFSAMLVLTHVSMPSFHHFYTFSIINIQHQRSMQIQYCHLIVSESCNNHNRINVVYSKQAFIA